MCGADFFIIDGLLNILSICVFEATSPMLIGLGNLLLQICFFESVSPLLIFSI